MGVDNINKFNAYEVFSMDTEIRAWGSLRLPSSPAGVPTRARVVSRRNLPTRNVTACVASNSRCASAVVSTAFGGGQSGHGDPHAPTHSPGRRDTRAEAALILGVRSEDGHRSHRRGSRRMCLASAQ